MAYSLASTDETLVVVLAVCSVESSAGQWGCLRVATSVALTAATLDFDSVFLWAKNSVELLVRWMAGKTAVEKAVLMVATMDGKSMGPP